MGSTFVKILNNKDNIMHNNNNIISNQKIPVADLLKPIS
jgi:hypothetical protein